MEPFIALFVVADIIIALVVILYIRKRVRLSVNVEPGAPPVLLSIEGIRNLSAFANAQNERIGNYMQANWNGTPEHLPTVLGSLLDSLEADARAQNLPVDRTALKSILEASLRIHKVGKGRDVRAALDKVA